MEITIEQSSMHKKLAKEHRILQEFILIITGTEEEYQSDAKSTKDTPYLALTGKLWGVFCEKIDHVIMAPHCTWKFLIILHGHTTLTTPGSILPSMTPVTLTSVTPASPAVTLTSDPGMIVAIPSKLLQ